MNRPLAVALTFGAVLWVSVVLTAPYLAAQGRASAPVAHLYSATSRICHQRHERSFAIAGVQMPVCARCSGLYIGGALGSLLGWMAIARAGSTRTRVTLLLAAIPTALTWSLEAAGVAGFSNSARAVAAVPLGLAAGWVFVGMLRYDADLDGRQIHNSRSRARSI